MDNMKNYLTELAKSIVERDFERHCWGEFAIFARICGLIAELSELCGGLFFLDSPFMKKAEIFANGPVKEDLPEIAEKEDELRRLLEIINRIDRLLKSHGFISVKEFDERHHELSMVREVELEKTLRATPITKTLANEQLYLNLMPEEIKSALNDYKAAEERLKGKIKAAKTAFKPMDSSADEILSLYNEACSICIDA
jgi:regulator of replication initiation timing